MPAWNSQKTWLSVCFFDFSSASSPGCGDTSSYNNPELLYVRTVGASQWCGSCPEQRESVRVVQYRLTRKGHYVSYQGNWEPLYIPECYPIETVPHINCITQLVTKLSDIVEQQTTTLLHSVFKQGNLKIDFQFTYLHFQFQRFGLNFTLHLFGINWPALLS